LAASIPIFFSSDPVYIVQLHCAMMPYHFSFVISQITFFFQIPFEFRRGGFWTPRCHQTLLHPVLFPGKVFRVLLPEGWCWAPPPLRVAPSPAYSPRCVSNTPKWTGPFFCPCFFCSFFLVSSFMFNFPLSSDQTPKKPQTPTRFSVGPLVLTNRRSPLRNKRIQVFVDLSFNPPREFPQAHNAFQRSFLETGFKKNPRFPLGSLTFFPLKPPSSSIFMGAFLFCLFGSMIVPLHP